MFGQMRVVLLVVSLALAVAGPCLGQPSGSGPIRVLLVSGGHAFDPSLLQVFEGQPDVRCEHREQVPGTSSVYSAPIGDAYDTLILYDMTQQISEEQRKNFLELFDEGRGLIVLHHSLASYQDWPLFEEIIGGRYHAPTPPNLPEGVSLEQGRLIVEFSNLEQLRQRFSELVKTANEFFKKMSAGPPLSTFQHDVKFDLKVVDSGHPVLTGVKSFTLLDEVYGRMSIRDGIQPLLVTCHPKSTPIVAWTKTYRNSRIVAIQPGHGPQAFQNPEFRRLLINAIRWTAHR